MEFVKLWLKIMKNKENHIFGWPKPSVSAKETFCRFKVVYTSRYI